MQSNPNPSKLSYQYQQPDSKVHLEIQKTQSSQHNTEVDEQGCKTDTIQLQDLLKSYSCQDNTVSEKEQKVDQWDRVGRPDIDPHNQVIFDKGTKVTQ